MDRKHIAAQLYTLRDFLETPGDVEKTMKKIRDIGYSSVQVSGLGPIDANLLKDIVDSLGIQICVTHISPDRLKYDLENVIREHKLWDCKYVGLGSMPEEYRYSREGFTAFIREFAAIAQKVSDSGLQFVYHNHKFEFEKFDGMSVMESLLNETNPRTFGFELDTYWIQAGGANPVEWIRKVKGRMAVVHFKDMAIVQDQQVFAEIGEGNLNWPLIIDACRETGVEWYAVEQDVCRRDPFDSLKISFDYLGRYL